MLIVVAIYRISCANDVDDVNLLALFSLFIFFFDIHAVPILPSNPEIDLLVALLPE